MITLRSMKNVPKSVFFPFEYTVKNSQKSCMTEFNPVKVPRRRSCVQKLVLLQLSFQRTHILADLTQFFWDLKYYYPSYCEVEGIDSYDWRHDCNPV